MSDADEDYEDVWVVAQIPDLAAEAFQENPGNAILIIDSSFSSALLEIGAMHFNSKPLETGKALIVTAALPDQQDDAPPKDSSSPSILKTSSTPVVMRFHEVPISVDGYCPRICVFMTAPLAINDILFRRDDEDVAAPAGGAGDPVTGLVDGDGEAGDALES